MATKNGIAKNERQEMNARVAAVREVVHNISTNDIVLALHTFDLDVQRTIQSFCDGSAPTALDSWGHVGGTKGKKKNKSAAAATTAPTGTSSTTSSVVSQPIAQKPAVPPPAQQPQQPKANGHAKEKPAAAAPPAKQQQQQQKAPTAAPAATTTPAAKQQDSALRAAFADLHTALDVRENQLARQARLPAGLLDAIAALRVAIDRLGVDAKSPRPNTAASTGPMQQSTSHSSLVGSEDSGIIANGSANGGQPSPVAAAQTVKPTPAPAVAKPTTTAAAATATAGGLSVQSAELSTAEIERITAEIQAAMLAKGLDQDLMSSIAAGTGSSSAPAPPRRTGRGGGHAANGGGGGGGNRGGRGGNNKAAQQPRLSILN